MQGCELPIIQDGEVARSAKGGSTNNMTKNNGLLRFARNDVKNVTDFSSYRLNDLSTNKRRKENTTMKNNKNVKNFSSYRLIDFPTLKKKAAFTLAEVLITLGIIGVVAAMTIPGLINDSKARKLRTKFLKSYSVVQQALKLMEADDISTDFQSYSAGTRHTTLAKYMTNVTICSGSVAGAKVDTPSGCKNMDAYNLDFGYKYLTASGYYPTGVYNDGQLMLADGTLIFFDDCPKSENWKGCMIAIDINGSEKPDRLGYDFFLFEAVDGKLYPMGDPHTTFAHYNDCNFDKANQFGRVCAKKAMSDSEYFKKLVKKIK